MSRADTLLRWREPVTSVRFVDESRATLLGRLGIATVGDLLAHYPMRYLDLTRTAALAAVTPGIDVTVTGTIADIKVKRPRPRLTITEIAIVDGTGALVGVWFNQPYMASRFAAGDRVAFAGHVELEYGLKQMRTPFVERLGAEEPAEAQGRVVPVHRTTEGLTTNWLRRLVAEALAFAGDVPDPLPATLRLERGLVSLRHALHDIHFPPDAEAALAARQRLAYGELLALQLGMLTRRRRDVDERPGFAHRLDGPAFAAFRAALPFTLTADQEAAIDRIARDLASPRPMDRMLLGDVGTGKTAVAAAAIAIVADSRGQAAMMAPTEVLAAQYALKLGDLLDRLGVRWRLLTGSTPAAERREVLAALASGEVQALFGTHALIQRDVAFKALSLVIVDEQHRFGVAQRLALRGKGTLADLLVMTATPIPRSLALTAYGDLDTTYLRARPNAAGRVTTTLVPRTGREAAYARVRAEVAAGRQAYVICAVVDETDAVQAKAATAEARRLQQRVFPRLRVGLLTGQMRPAEKAAVMRRFRDGAIDVLVATTVVEVGVDVPNATVMLIEDAERFGLAQLHQLRGRVGRGAHPGEVLLFAEPRTADAKARMQAIVASSDGFELAERDLALRGEGDILGRRQSGLPTLRLASLGRDADLVRTTRADAEHLLAVDPELRAPVDRLLAWDVASAFGKELEWVSAG